MSEFISNYIDISLESFQIFRWSPTTDSPESVINVSLYLLELPLGNRSNSCFSHEKARLRLHWLRWEDGDAKSRETGFFSSHHVCYLSQTPSFVAWNQTQASAICRSIYVFETWLAHPVIYRDRDGNRGVEGRRDEEYLSIFERWGEEMVSACDGIFPRKP